MEKKLIALVFTALLVGLGGGYGLGYVIYQPQVQNLQNDLNRLNKRFDAINATFRNMESSVTSLQNELSILNSEVTSLNLRLEMTENRTSPSVELLWGYGGYYGYGISGQWNTSKIQTEPFNERLNSTLNGLLLTRARYGIIGDPFDETTGKGYSCYVEMRVKEELSEADIERVRLLILEYLL